MSDDKNLAERIYESVSEEVEDVTLEEIQEEVEKFKKFGVQQDGEIRRSVLNTLADSYDIDRDELRSSSSSGSSGEMTADDTSVGDVNEDGMAVNLEVKVVELWDSNSEAVAQTGLIGDATGRIKFTTWADNNPPELEEGQTYRLTNMLSDEYQGRINVKGTQNTEIEEVDGDIQVGDNETTLDGVLIDIQDKSGLITRCPHEDCTRVLQQGRCNKHGEIDSDDEVDDLRLKAVLDDGENAYSVYVNRELTEELTGIDLDEAIEMAMDAMDKSVVASEMRDRLLGRYYTVTGPELGDTVLANEVEQNTDHPSASELLVEFRAM